MKHTLEDVLEAIRNDDIPELEICLKTAAEYTDQTEFERIKDSDVIVQLIESKREEFGCDKVGEYYKRFFAAGALLNYKTVKVLVLNSHWKLLESVRDAGYDINVGNQFAHDYLNSIHGSDRYKWLTGANARENPEHLCNALHHAVMKCDNESVEYLLWLGVDYNATDNAGLTPLDLLIELSQTGFNSIPNVDYFKLFSLFKGVCDYHLVIKAASQLNDVRLVGMLLADSDLVDLSGDRALAAFKVAVEYCVAMKYLDPVGLMSIIDASNFRNSDFDNAKVEQYLGITKQVPKLHQKMRQLRFGNDAQVSQRENPNRRNNAEFVKGVEDTVKKWKNDGEKFRKSYFSMWKSPKRSPIGNVQEIMHDYKRGKQLKGHVNRHHTDLSHELVKYCKSKPAPNDRELLIKLFAMKIKLDAKKDVNDDGAFNRRLHFMMFKIMADTSFSYKDVEEHDFSKEKNPAGVERGVFDLQ